MIPASMSAERFLLTIGSKLWKDAYGRGGGRSSDRNAQLLTFDRLGDVGPEATEFVTIDGEPKPTINSDIWQFMLFASKWVDGGCRLIESDAKYFSAMAQTKIGDAATELRIPWPAFAVRLPTGLIVDSAGNEYTIAAFAQFDDLVLEGSDANIVESGKSAYCTIFSTATGAAIHSYWPRYNLADLLFADSDPDDEIERHTAFELEEDASDRRIRTLVRRATVGLLFTMQHTNNWRFASTFNRPGESMKLRSGPPPHRTILIGKPIDIDMRESVRADARSGSRSAPSVQTLVRGHLKRQVVGIGGKGRKVMWIEPYWRGPEMAPILVRPLRVGVAR